MALVYPRPPRPPPSRRGIQPFTVRPRSTSTQKRRSLMRMPSQPSRAAVSHARRTRFVSTALPYVIPFFHEYAREEGGHVFGGEETVKLEGLDLSTRSGVL